MPARTFCREIINTEILLSRINFFHTSEKAILKNYKFLYNKKSIDGTTKANLKKDSQFETHGVCYEIDTEDLNILKNFEKGYDVVNVEIITHKNVTAYAKTFISNSTIEGILPSEDSDVLHLVISDDSEAESVEVSPNITAELNSNRELIGIEIFEASTFIRDSIFESVQARVLHLAGARVG
ncbi:Protein of unknown function [Desulfonatronum zhilinae]|nr:Protein of unknown function [Desulfonatronum zhilinae]